MGLFFDRYSNNILTALKEPNVSFFTCVTDGGMVTKGLRTAFVSTVTKVEAGDKVSQTTETLICYTVCCAVVRYFFLNFKSIFKLSEIF